MKTRKPGPEVAGCIELADKLSECPQVARYDSGEDKEAWALAHAFNDLEDSFRVFLDRLLPSLRNADSPEAVYDILLEIGEEFRHIVYHIRGPKFYRYLPEDSEMK